MHLNLPQLNILRILKLENTTKRLVLLFSLSIFVVGNILLSPLALRLDFSKGRAYTLSNSTKKIIKKIDKSVAIDFFVSSDLPTRLLPLKNEIVDLLREYKKNGGSKIQLSILDPKKDQSALKKAQEASIQEIQFSQVERDKYAVSSAYLGIALWYADKHETMPQVGEVDSLEYNLTAAIYKLIRNDTPKIGFVGISEPLNPQQDPIGSLRQVLAQQFQLETVDISTQSAQKTIDPSLKSLIVFDNNKTQYSQEEIQKLKEYLNNGGKGLFFIDGVWVGNNLSASEAGHNLFELFSDWGVLLNKNLILSASSELVNFGNDVVSYMVPYPLWVKTSMVNQKITYFSNVNQLTFPWVSSVSLKEQKGVSSQYLVKTTDKSWEQTGTFNLNPQLIPRPQEKDLKEFTIAAEAMKQNGGHIVVVPSSRFVGNRYLSRTTDNLEFVVNIINNLASGGDLAGIRQRSINFYPLPSLTENQQDVFKYANMFLLPGILALVAIIRLAKRK